jgi:Tfp pilus assembly protein PilF
MGQLTDEILGAPVPVGLTPQEVLQAQRDILEAGLRLALAALAQGSAEGARTHLEEALQRSIEAGALPRQAP